MTTPSRFTPARALFWARALLRVAMSKPAQRTCAHCGERPATTYSLCTSCRAAADQGEPTWALSHISGGPAARPRPFEPDPERAQALGDDLAEAEES